MPRLSEEQYDLYLAKVTHRETAIRVRGESEARLTEKPPTESGQTKVYHEAGSRKGEAPARAPRGTATASKGLSSPPTPSKVSASTPGADKSSPPRARGRAVVRVAGQPNKTESRYEAEVLIPRRAAGEVRRWWFEGIKLRLGDDCFYSPDYLVELPDGILELHEIKGFMEDDAAVKLSVVKTMYPFAVFVARYTRGAWGINEV